MLGLGKRSFRKIVHLGANFQGVTTGFTCKKSVDFPYVTLLSPEAAEVASKLDVMFIAPYNENQLFGEFRGCL